MKKIQRDLIVGWGRELHVAGPIFESQNEMLLVASQAFAQLLVESPLRCPKE
jgi:hypothetical protein